MNLDDIIKTLEAQSGLAKQASEDTEKDEKKDEDKAKSFFQKGEKEVDKAEKENDKEEKEDKECEEEDAEKQASAKGAALAQEVAALFAAQTQSVTKEDTMNKQAAAAGAAMADAILQKIANAGDMTTSNGIAPGLVPNKGQVDNAQMVAEDNAKVQPTPGTDGVHGGGSINQIFEAIIADASQGATSFNQVHKPGISAVEGDATAEATPNQVKIDDEVEKAAAVSALVGQGFDFEDAVGMVKAAAEEIEREETTQVKQATLASLISRGVDFDSAVTLVKQASFSGMASKGIEAGKAGLSKGQSLLKTNPKAAVGVAAGAGFAAGKLGQEKQAAVNSLVGLGVDFDDAVSLVNSKTQELYGA